MTLRKATLEAGDYLPAITRTITQEKINRFKSAGQVLALNNVEAGKTASAPAGTVQATGLPRSVAPSQMSFAYLHELLARQFGADFRQGGQLSVSFLQPVYPGDTLTARGLVSSREQIECRTRLTLQVWLENQQAEKTSEGHAQVVVPSPLT